MKTRLALLIGLSAAVALGACRAETDEGDGGEQQEGELRPLERKAIGKAVDYAADRNLATRTSELESSQKARRAVAWKALGRALKPVKLSEVDASVPTFRTWYGKDDFERMFGKLYGDLDSGARKERKPFSAADAKRAFDWNATNLGASTDADYFERLAKVNDRETAQGLAGNHRVAYSPGLFEHLFAEYGNVFDCLGKLDTMKGEDAPPSPTNFAPCYSKEFDADAALVKMSWYRASFGTQPLDLPVYDTSAKTIRERMTGKSDSGGWGKGVAKAFPKDDEIYTVTMSDGTKFRMPAMHLVTKELREWLWITIWWSPDADTDFGADRPAEIARLGGPWSHYKMNVTVAYEEKDADPRGGYEGTLGDAIEAAYAGVGGPSWASNPYLEKGAPNAQSNCIGCHQHAGTNENSESILADPVRFPKASRTKLRKNFPTDYLWAISSAPERLAGVIDDQVRHYDSVDR